MKNILTLITFLICACFTASAGPLISIPDTTIPRGSIYKIPVYADFSVLTDSVYTDSVEFVFQFNQYVIDLKQADLQNSDFFKSGESEVVKFYNSIPGSYRIKFRGTNLAHKRGILFYFNTEGLVAPTDTTTFNCTEVILNGGNIPFDSRSGLITVPGDPITRQYPTGLFINYPNPFSGSTIFNFNLHDGGKPEFKVYNYYGRLIYSETEISQCSRIMYLSGEGGQKEISDYKSEFAAGKYYFQFAPDPALFSSGLYFMTLKIGDKFYSQPFVYCK